MEEPSQMDEDERLKIPPYPRGRYWSDHCFVCGQENEAGLRARFVAENGRAEADVRFPLRLQGLGGVAHGGAIGALLDESLWYAFFSLGALTMTADLRVRYRKPVPTEEAVKVEAEITARKGRRFQGRTVLYSSDGTFLSEATGIFLAVPSLTRHLDALHFHAEALEGP